MKNKIVTSYYMDITDKPYSGQGPARKERYLGSIISHCRGFQCEVVCYTHERNRKELETIKRDYNLENLQIKIKEMHEVKYSAEIRRIEQIKSAEELEHLNGRPPEVLWGKFDVLKEEATSDVDFIYWIDAGLQSNQIFPYKYCPSVPDTVKTLDDFPTEIFQIPYAQYDFTRVFNRSVFEKLETLARDKIVVLTTDTPQCNVFNFENYSHTVLNYPIAGFFGGNTSIVRDFCDTFTEGANLYTAHDILDFEQAIMKYVIDVFPAEKMLQYKFETHQGGVPVEVFHFEGWTRESGYPKPIYAIWEEILRT